jgi:alpha-amylase/alpha-mannosidase (GH57 family)
MTAVALLWHMHQPYYEDLVTREHILPWVRMHALKDYYGMVALLEEFPNVRATFNLVPSLLVQLEAFAAGQAHDRYLEIGLKPADVLTPEERTFIVENFFSAQQQRMIEPYRRYAELLALRGHLSGSGGVDAAVKRFSTEDLRDLQVWQKLSWVDPNYLSRDARIKGLLEKGRDFSEEDKALLRTVELEILNAVIPAYRKRAEAGQIEISTSPFYHPILPLLCDTDIYKRTHPNSAMPRHRFQHPEDASEQLERAAAYHERLFGRRPVGLWPSEGSVSDAMVPLVAKAGFEWMATDELILARTLGTSFNRDGGGQVDHPRRLYTPYKLADGNRQVAIAFRDHALSDMIGFQYASWAPDAAANDFVSRLAEAGRRTSFGGGVEEPTIFVILDGENAWEHFEGGGRPFLRALYKRLSEHPDLRTVTMSEACKGARETLPGIFPGSWIDANFYIWIGHADDHRAWTQLAEARDVLESATNVDDKARQRAHEEILIGEGSDWFWWYGDDHSSAHDAEFDDLFRRHLRNVYRLLHRPAPDELFVTNISVGAQPAMQVDPTGLIHPTLDGEDSSYFEWLAAGEVDVREVSGAMHQTDRPRRILTGIKFGFDPERLLIRLDVAERAADILSEGYTFAVTFLEPEGIRVSFAKAHGEVRATLSVRNGGPEGWTERPFTGHVAAETIVEVAVPLTDLPGASNGKALSFVVTTNDPAGTEVERQPATHPVRVELPSPDLEARNWTA